MRKLEIHWGGRDLEDTARMFSLAIHGQLSKALRGSVKKSALYVVGEIQRRIRDGNYRQLAFLTAYLRGAEGYSKTPLMRTGALVRSISADVTGDLEAQIGALKRRRRKGGSENIALILHDGATIRVTDAMRKAFVRKLWAIGQRENLRDQNGRGTSVIRIPPRRFVSDVFGDAAVAKKIEETFFDELRARVELLK